MKREFDPLEEHIYGLMDAARQAIGAALPPGFNFAVFVFHKPGSDDNFVDTDADDETLVAAMKGFIAYSEREADRPPPPRR